MGQFTRDDISFDSEGDACAGWLYRPGGVENPPVVILCHGLGAVREMGLDAYAERFAEAGFAAMAFTYRHFGDSGGEPRQLLDIDEQLDDIAAALEYVRNLDGVDGTRVALWGSSFGGGHVMEAGARDADLKAVIAQCPFTDGTASGLTLGLVSTFKVTIASIADTIRGLRGGAPIYIGLAGKRGDAALMTAPDVVAGQERLIARLASHNNNVTARTALKTTFYRPGRSLKNVKAPTLVCVCENDTVAPAKPAIKFAKEASGTELQTYPIGHFDIYFDEHFEKAVADQIEFLERQLVPVRP
jgi:dienelactone hydrolase